MYIYDTDPSRCLNDIESVHNCDFVFVCVPTPMYEDGSQDLSYVESVFEKATDGPVYILKSTVLPGTTEMLYLKNIQIQKLFFHLNFLTERTAKVGYVDSIRIILGGKLSLTEKAKALI